MAKSSKTSLLAAAQTRYLQKPSRERSPSIPAHKSTQQTIQSDPTDDPKGTQQADRTGGQPAQHRTRAGVAPTPERRPDRCRSPLLRLPLPTKRCLSCVANTSPSDSHMTGHRPVG